MLHKKRVAQTIYYTARQRIRCALGLRRRHTAAPVLGNSLEAAVARHAWIISSILQHAPAELDLRGKAACEVGAGDCLAASSLFLGKGARRVNIVEIEPPVVNEKQLQILEKLKGQGLPLDLGIIQQNQTGAFHLDTGRVTYHNCFMEQFNSSEQHEFLFSFSVLEHVEDPQSFYESCYRALAPGGWMLHLIDLGGHALFEDPTPPLDFQTYPDWLYALMYPKYDRATRRFFNEHVDAVKAGGFIVKGLVPTRRAEEKYLEQLWPQLRRSARERSREELGVVEFALLAQKP
jgi:SAM-dependent methyltransferase